MTEIVTPGTLPEDQKIESRCGYCSCVFTFTMREAQVEVDQGETVYKVECPTCKKTVWAARHET